MPTKREQQAKPITFNTLSTLTKGAEELILNTVFSEKYGALGVLAKSQLLNNIRNNADLMTTYNCLNGAEASPIPPIQRMYAIVFNQNVPTPTEDQKIRLKTKLKELIQKIQQTQPYNAPSLTELRKFIADLPEPQAVEQVVVPVKVQTRKEGPTEEEIELAKARIVELERTAIVDEVERKKVASEIADLQEFIERAAREKANEEKLSQISKNQMKAAIIVQRVVRGFKGRKEAKKEILAKAQATSHLNLSALSLPNATLHHYIGPFTGIFALDGINYKKENPDFTRADANNVKALVNSSEDAIHDIIEAIKPEPLTIWNALLDNPNDKILLKLAEGIDIDKAIKAWVKRLSDTSEQGTIAFGEDTCENIDKTFALLNKIKRDWDTELTTQLGFIGRSYCIGKAFTANSDITTSQPNSRTRTNFLESIYATVKPVSAPGSFMTLMGEDQSQVNVNAIIDKFKSKGYKNVDQLSISKKDQTSDIKQALKAAIELGFGNINGFGQMQFNRIKQQISDSPILHGNCNVEALTKECLKEVFLNQLRSIDIQGLNIQDSLMKFLSDLEFIQKSTGSAEDLVKAHERIQSMKDNPVYEILNVIQSKYKAFEHLETDGKETVLDEVLKQYYQEITKKSDLSSVLSSMSSSAASKAHKEDAFKLFKDAVTGDVIGGIQLNDEVHNVSLNFLENSLPNKLSSLQFKTDRFTFLASEVLASGANDPKTRKERTQALHRAVEELKILHESIDKDFTHYPVSQGNQSEAQNPEFNAAKEAYTAYLKETAKHFIDYFKENLNDNNKGPEYLNLLTAYQTKQDSDTISGYATLAKELNDCIYIERDVDARAGVMTFLDQNIINHLGERFNGIFTKDFSIQSLITKIEVLKAELHKAVLDPIKEKELFNAALLKYQEHLGTVLDPDESSIQETILMYLRTASREGLFDNTRDYIRDMATTVCLRNNEDLRTNTLKDETFQALFEDHEDLINKHLTTNLTALISGATSQVISNLSLMMQMLTDTERNKIRKSSEGLKESKGLKETIIANIIGANIDESFKADVQNMLSIAYPNDGDHKLKRGEKGTKSGFVTSSHEFMDRIVNEVIKHALEGRHDTRQKEYYEELINILNEPANKIKETLKEDDTLLKVQALTSIFRDSKPDFGIGLAARFRDSFYKDVERLQELAKILTTSNYFDKKYGVQPSKHGFIRDIQEWIGLRTRSLDNAITGIAKEISNSGSIDDKLRTAVMDKLNQLASPKKESVSMVGTPPLEEEVLSEGVDIDNTLSSPVILSQASKPEYSAEAMICRIALGRHLSTLSKHKVVEFMQQLIPATVSVGSEEVALSEEQQSLYTECMAAYKNRPYFGKELIEAITEFFSRLIERISFEKLSTFMPKFDINVLGVLSKPYFNSPSMNSSKLNEETLSMDGSKLHEDEEESADGDEVNKTGLSESRKSSFNA